MNTLPKDKFNCPYLILAPMEGVGDITFHKAISSIGGFDEAVTPFLRVPSNAHVQSLASKYRANAIHPVPLAAQIMGSHPFLMGEMAKELEKRGAPRIDINCGCPSKIVSRRGAGSSLLKDPKLLYDVVSSVVNSVSIPVAVKMRSGYNDTSLFNENLLAVQESGVSYLTLHPRTKADGYSSVADLDLIAHAKSLLKIPVVGNGDILNATEALHMLKYTKCDGLMIGRGALINPFIFKEIRSTFSGDPVKRVSKDFLNYLEVYINHLPQDMRNKTKINKLKQILSFLFKGNKDLLEKRHIMLTSTFKDFDTFVVFASSLLIKND